MASKICYRVVYNHNNCLNKQSRSIVEIEARQGTKRKYFSTGIYIPKECFSKGLVINHPNAEKLNAAIIMIMASIEQIELDFFINGKYITLEQLKDCYKKKASPSALLIEFGKEIIENSDRKDSTKAGYDVLFNNLSKYRENILLQDVDYSFIASYDKWLKESGVMDNTRIGRLQQLKTIITEAYKRDIIPSNPFNRFKIPGMTNKQGHLTMEDINHLEKLKLTKKDKITRDAFLFSCYTGLRYSDMITLKSEHIVDGWIKKQMIKTEKNVEIPIKDLFDGKAMDLIEKYGKIENLVGKMEQNGALNRRLKTIFKQAKIEGDYTFHTARHTMASLLIESGVPITTIQKLLGHTKIATSMIYAEVGKNVIEQDIKKAMNKKK